MPLPPNVSPMRPQQQNPQQQPQQPQNPNILKARQLLLKAELLKLQAQELMQGGGKPQGQPKR